MRVDVFQHHSSCRLLCVRERALHLVAKRGRGRSKTYVVYTINPRNWEATSTVRSDFRAISDYLQCCCRFALWLRKALRDSSQYVMYVGLQKVSLWVWKQGFKFEVEVECMFTAIPKYDTIMCQVIARSQNIGNALTQLHAKWLEMRRSSTNRSVLICDSSMTLRVSEFSDFEKPGSMVSRFVPPESSTLTPLHGLLKKHRHAIQDTYVGMHDELHKKQAQLAALVSRILRVSHHVFHMHCRLVTELKKHDGTSTMRCSESSLKKPAPTASLISMPSRFASDASLSEYKHHRRTTKNDRFHSINRKILSFLCFHLLLFWIQSQRSLLFCTAIFDWNSWLLSEHDLHVVCTSRTQSIKAKGQIRFLVSSRLCHAKPPALNNLDTILSNKTLGTLRFFFSFQWKCLSLQVFHLRLSLWD